MAETSQTWWRGAWLRAVARTVKSWAESVLAVEAEPAPVSARVAPSDSTPADAAASTPVAPAATGSSVEALEARWLRDVQARQRGSAADWVARARKGAPHLAAELEREGLVAPVPPNSRARPAVSDRPGALPFARTAVKELHPVMRPAPPHRPDSAREPPEDRNEAAPPREVSGARAPEPSSGFATPPAATAGSPRPEPVAVPPVRHDAWGLGPEMLTALQPPPVTARGPARAAPQAGRSWSESAPAPDEAPPARRSPWDDLPAFADEASLQKSPRRLRVVPLLPEEERTLTELMATLPSESAPRPRPSSPSASRNEAREPPRNRVAFSVDDDAWAGAQSHAPWGAREQSALAPVPALVPVAPLAPPELEGEARTREAEPVSASEPAHPWPELPAAPSEDEERTEVATELRQWERLRRLDREQRGE